MATYQPCGHEVTPDVVNNGYEIKCPICHTTVHYVRNATDEPEVVLPGPELRRIERRSRKR